jgi:tRNA (cytidine/uridine-2'-O-)-methyltransferase
MIHIVLYEPEIPQNTGNISRTCAVTGCHLHLIEPLGFELSDRTIRRAGLDYWQYRTVSRYPSCEDFISKNEGEFYFCSTKGKNVIPRLIIPPTRMSTSFSERKVTGCPSRCLKQITSVVFVFR